jgi:hypothetical protein
MISRSPGDQAPLGSQISGLRDLKLAVGAKIPARRGPAAPPAVVVFVALLVGPLFAPHAALANGSQCHVWIAQRALAQTQGIDWAQQAGLRDVIANAAIFPDGGYAIQHGYGEIAHWEPFLTRYIANLRGNTNQRGNKAGLTGVDLDRAKAFVLGLGAHGMADQVFDASFMKKARVKDAKGWASGLFNSLDSMSDVMLVAQDGPVAPIAPWWPKNEIMAVYAELGVEVSATQIDDGQGAMANVVLQYGAEVAKSAKSVKAADDRYPWSSAHLLDATEPGSLPCEAFFVARYMEALGARLANADTPLTMLGSIPRAGSDRHPTDHTRVDSQIVLVFSHGIDRDKVAKHAVTLSDIAANPIAVELHWWSSHGNLLRVVPTKSLQPLTQYTVAIKELTSIDGAKLTAPLTFTFRTLADGAKSSDVSACGPPIASPLKRAKPPTDACTATLTTGPSGGRYGTILLLFAALAVLVVLRRAAPSPTSRLVCSASLTAI